LSTFSIEEIPEENLVNDDAVVLTSTKETEGETFVQNDYSKFEKGEDKDWSLQNIIIKTPITEIKNWLLKIIEKSREKEHVTNNNYGIPLHMDGSKFEIDALSEDQTDVIAYILNSLQKWIQYHKDWEPLFMNVTGVAGSGKSTLINTLVTIIREMFQNENTVIVTTPTGAAAYNAGGTTCHHAFSFYKPNMDSIGEETLKTLRNRYTNPVCLIIDEQSMLSSEVFATMIYRSQQTFYNGHNKDSFLGNIPIAILVGDYFQLPSIQKGTIYCKQSMKTNVQALQLCGERAFEIFSQDVMALKESKRQNANERTFADLLSKARCEESAETMTPEDA
jgi:energy-coupling factor transporter ATP-binding protein EcfA2